MLSVEQIQTLNELEMMIYNHILQKKRRFSI